MVRNSTVKKILHHKVLNNDRYTKNISKRPKIAWNNSNNYNNKFTFIFKNMHFFPLQNYILINLQNKYFFLKTNLTVFFSIKFKWDVK